MDLHNPNMLNKSNDKDCMNDLSCLIQPCKWQ